MRVVAAESCRVGIIVPRHRHSAVDRNRLKRRLRELVRTRLLPVLPTPPGLHPCELVVRARAEAYDDDFAALARQIDRVVVNLTTPREP